jgi:hypothetical protein
MSVHVWAPHQAAYSIFFIFLTLTPSPRSYRYDFVTEGSDAPRPYYIGELQLPVLLYAESIFVSKIIEIVSVAL